MSNRGGEGGDDGSGTVNIPKCPYCSVMFFDYDTMVNHIARHEGGTREAQGRGEKVLYQNKLEEILKSKT